jgi:hypothetical protein
MLFGNDVLNVMSQVAILLMQQAIFTPVFQPVPALCRGWNHFI